MRATQTEKSPIEQVSDFLNGLKEEINELKALRDASVNPEFKEDYQRKVTEKVEEYNSYLKGI